jgi:hypothetical protein
MIGQSSRTRTERTGTREKTHGEVVTVQSAGVRLANDVRIDNHNGEKTSGVVERTADGGLRDGRSLDADLERAKSASGWVN